MLNFLSFVSACDSTQHQENSSHVKWNFYSQIERKVQWVLLCESCANADRKFDWYWASLTFRIQQNAIFLDAHKIIRLQFFFFFLIIKIRKICLKIQFLNLTHRSLLCYLSNDMMVSAAVLIAWFFLSSTSFNFISSS